MTRSTNAVGVSVSPNTLDAAATADSSIVTSSGDRASSVCRTRSAPCTIRTPGPFDRTAEPDID